MKKFDGRRQGPVAVADQGTATITNSTVGSMSVVFPPGTFSVPPIVTVIACFGTYSAMTSGPPTVNGFTAIVRKYNEAAETRTITVQYTAISRPPANSAWRLQA